jgi:hypothetical protein
MSALPTDIERVALIGWRIYPASNRGRAACITGPGVAATCDLDKLESWAREFPGCNWRVVFGPSGLWGLDCDVPPGHAHDGIANLNALVKLHGPLPARPQARSGGGGLALFFRHDGEPIIGEAGHPAPGIDPRRGRQSQTIPPSRHHHTGRHYRWITPPWELPPPPAPAWLLRLVAPLPEPPMPVHRRTAHSERSRRPYAVGALRRAVEQVSTAPAGQRNDSLNRAVWSVSRFIADGLLSPAEIAEALAYAGRVAGLHRLEIEATLASALAAGARR